MNMTTYRVVRSAIALLRASRWWFQLASDETKFAWAVSAWFVFSRKDARSSLSSDLRLSATLIDSAWARILRAYFSSAAFKVD